MNGRTALVTGAGRGIGRAIAVELGRSGAAVGLLARTRDELEATAELVAAAGGRAVVLPADVADAGQVDAALEALPAIDILINNAAVVWPLGPSATVDPEDWARALAINVTAVARLTFATLGPMLARGWGRIVNVSSGVAERPDAMIGANAYATGKAALEAHTVNLAAELAGTGVTVNAFRPGMVDTAMQTWIREQDPVAIGAALHDRFTRAHDDGVLIAPERAAAVLIDRLGEDETGQIWGVA
jgi:3-oxoacyl-[acyl-carrier protein] reductase